MSFPCGTDGEREMVRPRVLRVRGAAAIQHGRSDTGWRATSDASPSLEAVAQDRALQMDCPTGSFGCE